MSDLSHFLPRTQTALDQAKQQQLSALANSKAAGNNALDKVSKEFEQIFLSQMLKPMFASLSTDGPMGGGFAEEMYRDLLVDEYAKTMINTGGIGVADHVKRELMTLQEIQ